MIFSPGQEGGKRKGASGRRGHRSPPRTLRKKEPVLKAKSTCLLRKKKILRVNSTRPEMNPFCREPVLGKNKTKNHKTAKKTGKTPPESEGCENNEKRRSRPPPPCPQGTHRLSLKAVQSGKKKQRPVQQKGLPGIERGPRPFLVGRTGRDAG